MAKSLALIALLACATLAGCNGSSESLFIGAAGPWRETFAANIQRGIDLAIEEQNAAGAALGRKLEVVYRDDEARGEKAASIAQDFVDDARIVAVIGHANSGAMMAAAQVYDGELTAVATTATSPDLSGISEWTFRVISSDSGSGLALARFASGLGRKRAAVIYENNNYGRGLADVFRRNFRGEVISADPIARGQESVEPFVAYWKMRAPDLVFFAGTDEAGLALVREARRQRLAADFIGDGMMGVVSDAQAAEGVYVGAPFSADDPRAEAQRFVQSYKAKYGTLPDGNAALGYDAAMVVARAIAQKGRSRQGVRAYLAALSQASAHAGATGPIRFSASGDRIDSEYVVLQARGGVLRVAAGQR
ncbi:MAG: ABC transporter substrate-binding protein [Gemmatimonadaceae bacterium]